VKTNPYRKSKGALFVIMLFLGLIGTEAALIS